MCLDTYFKNRLKPSRLPFNIMKIIDLLDEQGSDYSIDEVLAIANVARKILDKSFNLKTGLTFKTYAGVREVERGRRGFNFDCSTSVMASSRFFLFTAELFR